ncbi:hypothetical protein OKW96_03525 [Sphingobacterium sp. KU25419]|nr:hypothetical protein OKW96_03525 [Sphingobacterium sp. KU25419]
MDQIMFYVSMICAFAVIFNVGYVRDPELATLLDHIIHAMFYALFVMTGLRTASSIFALKKIAVEHYSGLVILTYFTVIIIARFASIPAVDLFGKDQWIYLGIYLVFITELSKSTLFFDNFILTLRFICYQFLCTDINWYGIVNAAQDNIASSFKFY